MKRALLLGLTHLVVLGLGFALGIYVLPILIAPPAPGTVEIDRIATAGQYHAEFRRNLEGSDLLHWGEGRLTVGPEVVTFVGRIAPGPAYKLYLAPEWVETEAEFLEVRARSARLGDVRTFENFVVPVPNTVDVSRYDTVVVWCEAFSQFITAAKYR